MKIGLTEQAWESMRTPEEEALDQDREDHMDGCCRGVPACSWCREEEEWAAEQRTKEINEAALRKLEPLREALKSLDVGAINRAFGKMTR